MLFKSANISTIQWGVATEFLELEKQISDMSGCAVPLSEGRSAQTKGGLMSNSKSAWQVGAVSFAVVFKAVAPFFDPTGAVLVAILVTATIKHMC